MTVTEIVNADVDLEDDKVTIDFHTVDEDNTQHIKTVELGFDELAFLYSIFNCEPEGNVND